MTRTRIRKMTFLVLKISKITFIKLFIILTTMFLTKLGLPTHCHSTKFRHFRIIFLNYLGVNLTNILPMPFLREFSLITVGFVIFWQKNIGAKAASKCR